MHVTSLAVPEHHQLSRVHTVFASHVKGTIAKVQDLVVKAGLRERREGLADTHGFLTDAPFNTLVDWAIVGDALFHLIVV